MVTKVQPWGNSQGLRLSRQLLQEVGISVGDALEVKVEEGRIVLSPARRGRGTVSLQELVREIPPGYRAGEVEWGTPKGDEVW